MALTDTFIKKTAAIPGLTILAFAVGVELVAGHQKVALRDKQLTSEGFRHRGSTTSVTL
jgi:hypothetical protein